MRIISKENDLQSIRRSALRLILGRIYYTTTRYMLWLSCRYDFAKIWTQESLPYVKISHKTPILRKLKDVDMQYQYNKIINLKLAVSLIDGIILKLGETFSYWKLIEETTRKKCYLDGMVLYHGTFGPGIGGGLCQLSNLIY